jgi:hypothetical protein
MKTLTRTKKTTLPFKAANDPPPTVHVKLTLIDGSEQTYELQPRPGTEFNVGTRIDKLLHQTNIALALDDRLVIIPTHQIRSIEVSPLLTKLPDHVVANVRRIS